MAKRDKQKARDDEEEELKELKSARDVNNSDDDEEANEDLSLKIVEKALLKRGAKLVENDSDGAVLEDDVRDRKVKDDSGVVGVRGGGVVEPAASAAVESVVVVRGTGGVKKRRRKKKIQKTEIKDHTSFIASEEEKAETIDKPETVEKVEAVEAAEVVEPVDPNGIEISDNIVLRKLLRGPRYFDPPDSSWTTCYNCGEEGHMAVNCVLVSKKKKPCFVCGSLDHGAKQCPKGRDCYICKNGGHRAKDCPEKHKGTLQSSKICLKCGDYGHDMLCCRNSYSLDDLKEIQCYVCKSFGHLCCADFVDISPRKISCYRCGELGHTGLACARLHEEATNTPSPSSCYKCGEEGHFASECTNSAKARKRIREPSTPTLRAHGKNKDNLGSKSAPQDHGKTRKKKKKKSEKRGLTTPQKSKHRGGWITGDPGDASQSKSKKKHYRSPSTPFQKGQISSINYNSHTPISQPYNGMQSSHFANPSFQGSTPFHHRYSASRFGQSGDVYGNTGGRYVNSGGMHGNTSGSYGNYGGMHGSSGGTYGNYGGMHGSSGGTYGNQGGMHGSSDGTYGNYGGMHGRSGGMYGNQGGMHGSSGGIYGNYGGMHGSPGGMYGKHGSSGMRRNYDWW